MKKLLDNELEIEKIFRTLVRQLSEVLPDLWASLAIDSKAIPSFANHKNKNTVEDGRRDIDADYGTKTYSGQKEDGGMWEKIARWFGYKLHLIVDSIYELPVAYSVTKASVHDVKEAHRLLDEIFNTEPKLLENAKVLSGDKGYDDTELITRLWDDHEIKPVIDIRNMWKDGEETRLLGNYMNVAHDYKGTIFCYCPLTGKEREMVNGGF